MPRVTLLLTGVPQYVTLQDLSYNLDILFNTDEIATFKVRDLPNNPQTYKRQIALDFHSGYDAMAAQEKLDGYKYELDNGREYTLHARINKLEEYKCRESPEYAGSHWYGDDWIALSMVPNVSDRDMYRAHSRLDAQLELLKKQQLVLEQEKDLLNERMRLKRKYKSLHSCEAEVSPPKRSRSTSRDRRSSSNQRRSGSREIRSLWPRTSRSKDSGYVVPQIEWHGEQEPELKSHSGENSRARSRDGRPILEGEDYRFSRRREERSRKSASREHGLRARMSTRRSRSKDRVPSRRSRSRSDRDRRGRRLRSPPRQQSPSEWSRSKDRVPSRRSRSRSDRDRRGRRLRSPRQHSPSEWWRSKDRVPSRRSRSRSDRDRRGRRLRSPRQQSPSEWSRSKDRVPSRRSRSTSPSDWSFDSQKAATTPTDNEKQKEYFDKKVVIKVEKDATTGKHSDNNIDTKNIKKDKEKRKIEKYNRKLRKAEKTAFRVQALSKDIMILVAIVVDDIMNKNNIKITASNKVALLKHLEELVHSRLEPIARVKKNTDSEVLKKYKLVYPMVDDRNIIKEMLDEIPKINEPEATVTVCPTNQIHNIADDDILDVDSVTTELQNTTTISQIKREPKVEPVIDLDSSDKSRHPQFVAVIKAIVKNMNKVIRSNKLDKEITFAELKHVLRHVLRNIVKRHGCIHKEEVLSKFREVYPMENDEQFVKNAIKDIRDGNYPGLTGHIADIPENDDADDIVLIEKKYDIVTVTDSDGAENQECPGSDRNELNEDSKGQREDNNLKVTAITIVTSLNELIGKTAKEPEDAVTEEIKKEVEFEEEAELDESSVKIPDNAPRVTSITIMTSDSELVSLGHEERKEESEIKNESDICYDAEDKLVNDIERALDDPNFGNSILEAQHIKGNSANSEQFTSKQCKSKTPSPQDAKTVQDDDETIESIVKYVASMY